MRKRVILPLALMAAAVGAGCTSTPEPMGAFEAVSTKAQSDAVVVMRPRGAECITPERVRTFRGDAYCDTLHPVWGEGGAQEAISREDIRGTAPSEYGDGKMRSRHIATFTADRVGVSDEEDGAEVANNELLTAWQRYCNAGRDMTERDWALVEGCSIPDGLKADCIVPK